METSKKIEILERALLREKNARKKQKPFLRKNLPSSTVSLKP